MPEQLQNHSPIRAQYLQIKQSHPDTILFFRMGDFYELFDEDAQIASRELEIALTRREFGRGERSPMAGVPHHAASAYVQTLLERGFKVAICEQMADPAKVKGIVPREVVRVVMPGIVYDDSGLDERRNQAELARRRLERPHAPVPRPADPHEALPLFDRPA